VAVTRRDVFVSNFTSTGAIYEFSPRKHDRRAAIETGLTYPTSSLYPLAWEPFRPGLERATTLGRTPAIGAPRCPGSISAGPYTDTSTALFNQSVTFMPAVIDANRNVMNITFDTVASRRSPSGQQRHPAADGRRHDPNHLDGGQSSNICLPARAGRNRRRVDQCITSSTTASPARPRSPWPAGSPRASAGVTTLNLSGTNTGTNTISGAMTDGGNGSSLALAVQGWAPGRSPPRIIQRRHVDRQRATLQLANASGSR